MATRAGHLGLPISMVLAIFDLQITLVLPTKFGVSWPFGSGEEAKNRFSRWRPWWPPWISDWNDFSDFWSISPPYASYQVSSQLALGLGEEAKNRFSRWLPWRPFFTSSPEPKGQLTQNLLWSIRVTCRSKIAKIVPIENPRWPPWPPSWKSIFRFFAWT